MFLTVNDSGFHAAWNNLYNETCLISPFYSKKSLKYYSQRPLDQKKIIEDLSFVYIKDNKPCVAFIIAKVQGNDRVDLMAYEAPATSLIKSESLSRKDIITINNRVDYTFEVLNGTFFYRDYLIDGNINQITRRLLTLGCIPYPFFSSIIDLSYPIDCLHQNIRKSYKSLLNWGERELTLEIYDYKNADIKSIESLKNLHIKVSGRKTRSDDSWYRQYELIKEGEAFLILGRLENELVTGSFYMLSRNVCYYGVSVSIREMFDKPLSHYLVWKAIKYAKDVGCKYFEMGEQSYPGAFYHKDHDQKLIAISDFKAGFGGNIKTYIDLHLDKYKT